MTLARLATCWTMVLAASSTGCQKSSPSTSTKQGAAPPALTRDQAAANIQRLGGKMLEKGAFGPGLLADFSRSKITDQDMPEVVRNLKLFPELDQLDLSDTAVSEVGLAEVKALTNLKFLRLSGGLEWSKTVEELRKANQNLGILYPFKTVDQLQKP